MATRTDNTKSLDSQGDLAQVMELTNSFNNFFLSFCVFLYLPILQTDPCSLI